MGLGDKIKQVGAKISGSSHNTDNTGYTGTETGYGTGAGMTGASGYNTAGTGLNTSSAGYGNESERGDLTRGRETAATSGVDTGFGTGTDAYGAHGTTRTEQVPVGVVETTTTVQQPVVEERTTTQTGQAAVCGQEFFTKTEDRPIVKERVERILEHRPVEKEFVVETRATGVEKMMAGDAEHLGTTERVVQEAAPRGPCE